MKLPRELTVAVVETVFLQEKIENGTTTLIGTEGKFLHMLMTALNVSYNLVRPKDRAWGSDLGNGSFNGMVGMVQRGEADIALNQISITGDRLRAVDFSVPYTDELTKFAAPAPKRISSPIVYLYPFDRYIWASNVISLILLPLIYILFFSNKETFASVFVKLFGCLMGQALEAKRKASLHRFFSIICFVFARIISFAYCAVLLSFLSFPLYEPVVRNLDELAAALVKGRVQCHVNKGSFVLDVLKKAETENLKTINEVINRNGWIYDSYDLTKNFFAGKAIIINSEAALKTLLRYDKDIIFSEDSLITVNIGVALRKDFCCKEKLNKMLSRIRSAGLYLKLKSEGNADMSYMKAKNHKEMPISFANIYGVLIALAFGCILSLLVLIVELCSLRSHAKIVPM